ncbi:hypothetical protein TNCV_1026311 [Trichonephila clavipes]|nr:hypothetical protein TNCV_1026311 [Trichonephila clavipes]
MEDGIGEMTHLNTPGYNNWFKYNVYSPQLPLAPVLFSSTADHVSEKPTITTTTSSFATGCFNFLTPSKNTRKQHNNLTSSNMRTYDHPGKNQLQTS